MHSISLRRIASILNLANYKTFVNKQTVSSGITNLNTSFDKFNQSKDQAKDQKQANSFKEIYCFSKGERYFKLMYRVNMAYLYCNSVLFFFEVINPIFGKSMHSIVLAGGLLFGWGINSFLGSLINRTVKSIKYDSLSEKLVITFYDFNTESKPITVHHKDIVDLTISNIEGFHFFVNKQTGIKYYISLNHNVHHQNKQLLDRLFPTLLS